MENTVKLKAEILFAFLWFFSFIWFFVAQIIVGAAWHDPAYNWREQNLSDLGITGYPLHALMNATFIFQGAVLAIGVWLVRIIWHKTFCPVIARVMLSLAGVGWIVIGLTPYNLLTVIHTAFGAIPVMAFCSAGLIFAGYGKNRVHFGRFWIVTVAIGIACLVSGCLYFSGTYLYIGKGAMERIWLYAPLVWTLVISCRVIFVPRSRPAWISAAFCHFFHICNQ